jgi:hypothetical protein
MGSIHEKNQRSTISCYCTFKSDIEVSDPTDIVHQDIGPSARGPAHPFSDL